MDDEAAIDAPLRALSAALGLPPLALRAEVDAVLAALKHGHTRDILRRVL